MSRGLCRPIASRQFHFDEITSIIATPVSIHKADTPKRMTMRYLPKLLLVLSLCCCRFSLAEQLTLPIALDYGVVRQALAQQLFTGDNASVLIYSDSLGCNSLSLANPRVVDGGDGLIGVLSSVSAQMGTPVGGRCLMPMGWQGDIETLQQVFVTDNGQAIGFRIVDSSVIASGENASQIPEVLWRWVKSYIHPQLSAVTINMGSALGSLQQLLSGAVESSPTTAPALSTLGLQNVSAKDGKLSINLGLDVPQAPHSWLPEDSTALSAEELAQWNAAWQAWDGFATWMIKTVAAPADQELARHLGEILLESRYDLYEALSSDDKSRDPVRDLFAKTWERLAPLLRENQLAIPGGEALQFATFITAADALQTLDSAAPHLGLRFDSDTFRSLARLILPTVTDADLSYTTEVDPELRQLLGFDPSLEEEKSPDETLEEKLKDLLETEGEELLLPFVWLVPRAMAADVDPRLIKKLTDWVPTNTELDDYLDAVNRIFDEIARAEREKGKVPAQFYRVYESLLMATAWQESCWRQYVDKGGKVQPILSSAGSVGMMQVNQHVWRGIYNPVPLHNNIAYNARAGNEILVHYLVDYAIKKKEHQITGNPDNLARAAYAVYNGGPRHLSRYRDPNNRKSLQQIDAAFWKKYQAIAKNGRSAVKQCYGS